jgi:hypothetical protein
MKLWPFRRAAQTGQNAIAIQMIAIKTYHKTDMTYPPSAPTTCPTETTARR